MRNIGPTVLLLFLLASAGIASADYLTVNLGTICYPPYSACNFQNYINGPGSPAQGFAMFEVMTATGSRWSFNFTTPDPYSWGYDRYHFYYANFGTGGTFTMTGPDDLTLLGEITSGFLFDSNGEAYIIDLDFSGQWSNSRKATGELWINDGGAGPKEAHLGVTTGSAPTEVPEPATLVLLGSAVAGLWRYPTTAALMAKPPLQSN